MEARRVEYVLGFMILSCFYSSLYFPFLFLNRKTPHCCSHDKLSQQKHCAFPGMEASPTGSQKIPRIEIWKSYARPEQERNSIILNTKMSNRQALCFELRRTPVKQMFLEWSLFSCPFHYLSIVFLVEQRRKPDSIQPACIGYRRRTGFEGIQRTNPSAHSIQECRMVGLEGTFKIKLSGHCYEVILYVYPIHQIDTRALRLYFMVEYRNPKCGADPQLHHILWDLCFESGD